MEYELNAELPGLKQAGFILVTASLASQRLTRNYWIITRKYGNGYFDVQKESALIYNFSSSTGQITGGSSSNDDVTKYSYVLCILPGARYLDTGDVVKLGFYRNNTKRPYIKQIVKSRMGKESLVPDVPAVLSGKWIETWGPYFRNPLGISTADPLQWPGGRRFDFETNPEGGAGNWGVPPLGLLLTDEGNEEPRAWLVYLKGGANPEELFVQQCNPPFWDDLYSESIELTDAIDTDNGATSAQNPRAGDSAVIWRISDLIGPFITVIPRPRAEAPAAWGAGGLANLWTVRDSSGFIVKKSQITVGEGRGLWQFAVSQPTEEGSSDFYAARLAFDQSTLYGYRLNKDDLIGDGLLWEDAWNVDWVGALNSFQSNLIASQLGHGGTGLRDISPPQRIEGGSPNWVVPGVTFYQNGSVEAYSYVKLSCRQEDGALLFTELLQKGNWTLGEAINPADALGQIAAEVYDENPGYHEYDLLTNMTQACDADEETYEYQRRDVQYWRGIVDNQWAYTVTLSGGESFNIYLAQGRDQSDVVSAGTPCGLLTVGGPNLLSRELRPFWWPQTSIDNGDLGGRLPREGGRFVATATGRLYTAVLLPVPIKLPGNVNVSSVGPTNSYSAFGGCWFTTETVRAKGIIPSLGYVYELTFVGIRDNQTVDTIKPLTRHVGLPVAYGELASPGLTSYTTNQAIPVPENVYGIVVFEDIECVCWLCDSRASGSADPAPCVIVTDLDLTQVRYKIPASTFVPTTVFDSDQTHEDSTWAYAGESKFRFHPEDPEMKGWVREYTENSDLKTQHLLAIGISYYERVTPVETTEGEAKSKTFLVNVDRTEFSLLKTDTINGVVSFPSVSYFDTTGPMRIRTLAAGGDFACYVRNTGGEDSFSIYGIE